MILAFGVARLGRDVELRYTQAGDPVCGLSLAFEHGRKGQDGQKPVMWIDASLWGKRAEGLSPYLLKGMKVSVTLEDLHVEKYTGRNGEAQKLVARITDIDLGAAPAAQDDNVDDSYQPPPRERASPPARPQAPARPPAARPPPPRAAPSGSGFDNMDSDIPFAPMGRGALCLAM